MSTPTFVGVIEETRRLKSVFAEMKIDMGNGRKLVRTAAEGKMVDQLVRLFDVLEGNMQSLSSDVAKLAMNSTEDMDKIMEALSK